MNVRAKLIFEDGKYSYFKQTDGNYAISQIIRFDKVGYDEYLFITSDSLPHTNVFYIQRLYNNQCVFLIDENTKTITTYYKSEK